MAEDGQMGEDMAFKYLPQVILLDVSLPKKSGWEVSQTLRKNESTQDIPIIILTAHVFPEDRRKAEDLGCNSFLPKPLKPREVLHEIQSLLHPVNQP